MTRGRLCIVVSALVVYLSLLGCGTGRLPRARVMNASPDSPQVDVSVGGITVSRNLAFRAISGYDRINDGFNDVLVFASRSNDLLLEGVPFFAQRQDYTIVVLDSVQFLDAVLLTDDNSAPAANNFKLRFVHAATTAAAVDVYITAPNADLTSATPAFVNVVFGGFAGYNSQPQGTFQLRATLTGTKNLVADSGALAFMAGQVRTAVLVDPPGTATEPLGIVLLQDVQ
jgi:Domain of unknown function (DUF4397)